MVKNHDLERLKALTDGVIAVSITLLVLDIHLTRPLGELSDAQLGAQFMLIWQKYLSYAISFIVVGVFWMSHQRKFSHIVHADSALVWLNFLFLMAVCLVPFVTGVIGENTGRLATTVYASTMLSISFLLWLMWWYAGRKSFIDPNLSHAERRHQSAIGLISIGVFVACIVIAQFDTRAALMFLWLLLVPNMLWRTRSNGEG
jgi:uncharacterized membrane protein